MSTATARTASPRQAKAAEKKLPGLIAERMQLADRLADIEAEIEAIDATLIETLGMGGSIEVPDVALVTVMSTTSHTIDLDVVKSLHPTWARKITKQVLDVPKFNLLRKADQLPADIRPLVLTRESAPFLRITKR